MDSQCDCGYVVGVKGVCHSGCAAAIPQLIGLDLATGGLYGDWHARGIKALGPDALKAGIAGGSESGLSYEEGDSAREERVDYHRVTVPQGGEYNLRLADGTEVWLFAESELYFPIRFRGKSREVYLSGEGYFEVRRDTARPFVVRTDAVNVRVLGTSFNVKAYADEATVETSLVEGRVSVGGRVLTPDTQAVYERETGEFSFREINGDNYRLRKERMFVFDRERLDDILREMSRWYGFVVFYQNPALADKRFGCQLQKYEQVESLLDILELTGVVGFEYKNKVLIVKDGRL